MRFLNQLLHRARSLAPVAALPPLMHREPIRNSRRATGSLQYRLKPVAQLNSPYQPTGRYTGAALRDIRATGQARECARRLKRRASC